MKKNRKRNSVLTILSLLMQAYIGRIKELFQLASHEAQLAIHALVTIGVLVFILGSLLTSTWLSLLGILFFYLVNISYSYFSAACVVFCFNTIMMMLLILIVCLVSKQLTFRQTRHQIQVEHQEFSNKD